MAKCILCGAKIKPYFEICYECYQQNYFQSKRKGPISFPEPIVRSEFMQRMGIA